MPVRAAPNQDQRAKQCVSAMRATTPAGQARRRTTAIARCNALLRPIGANRKGPPMTIEANLQKCIAGMAQSDPERKGTPRATPCAPRGPRQRAHARASSSQATWRARRAAGAIGAPERHPAKPSPRPVDACRSGRASQAGPTRFAGLRLERKLSGRPAAEGHSHLHRQKIVYTGQRLDQGDLEVWECVLQFASAQAMGDRCQFTAYAMLKMLGRADTGGNRQVLDARLSRLKATVLCIVTDVRYPEVQLD